MGNKWVNLADLSATRKPDYRSDYGDGIDRRRYPSPGVSRLTRKQRERDRARDRDQEDEANRQDDRDEV